MGLGGRGLWGSDRGGPWEKVSVRIVYVRECLGVDGGWA